MKQFLNKTKNGLTKTAAAIGVACLITFSSFTPKSETILTVPAAHAQTNDRMAMALINVLRSKNKNVRKYAAEELGKIRVNDTKFKIILRMLQNGKSMYERLGAAEALGKLRDARAVPALIEALKNKEKEKGTWKSEPFTYAVRNAAAKALGEIGVNGGQLKTILKILQNGKDNERIGVVLALKSLKYNFNSNQQQISAINALIRAFKDKNEDVRDGANRALIHFGTHSPYLPSVFLRSMKALKSNEKNVRLHAAVVLGGIGNIEAVPDLIDASKDKERDVRYKAIEALGKIAEKNPGYQQMKKAVPTLLDALEDKNSDVREAAAYALYHIVDKKTVDKKTIQSLLKSLKNMDFDNDSFDDLYAAQTLAKIRKPALKASLKALKNKDQKIRAAAAFMLRKIGGLAAVSPLTKVLRKDRSIIVMRMAADSIAEIAKANPGNPRLRRAVPVLIRKMNSDFKYDVFCSAAPALSMINDPRVVPALYNHIIDKTIHPKEREMTYYRLQDIAKTKWGKAGIRKLISRLERSKKRSDWEAASTLRSFIDKPKKPVISP
jgi:HEAT repeat protein